MKKLLGFALVVTVAVFLYRRFVNAQRDPLREHLAEQEALKEIGDAKRSVSLAAEVPFSSWGKTPWGGQNLNPFNTDFVQSPQDLQLFPKGTWDNPNDYVVSY
jgi:hypothetical protein